MSNLSIRGLDPAVMAALKTRAQQDSASVNGLVVRLLGEAVGGGPAAKSAAVHHDLDALAGTWSEQDEQEFRQATQAFAEVDPELWGMTK